MAESFTRKAWKQSRHPWDDLYTWILNRDKNAQHSLFQARRRIFSSAQERCNQ